MKPWFAEAYAFVNLRFVARMREAVMRTAGNLPKSLHGRLVKGWDERVATIDDIGGKDTRPANHWLQEQTKGLRAARFRAAYDERLIRDHAENYATLCGRMTGIGQCRDFGRQFGVEPPAVVDKDAPPAEQEKAERMRWCDPLWWRRQLRKVWTREAENAMRGLGIIRKQDQPYASDEAVEHREARQRRVEEWAAERVMASETGEQLELSELMKASLANPALRRAEFMTRIRGFDEVAQARGDIGQFWTLTTPSRFHAQHFKGGINPKWETDRARVRDGQLWLRKAWARTRAALAQHGVRIYGFRIAEPHHDATPHWHCCLFTAPHHAGILREVVRSYWLLDSPNEEGAQRYRVRAIDIDPSRGSAAGYVAKYVSKNIDGKDTNDRDAFGDGQSDEAPLSATDNARRVAAWASVHGIRQFQQIGGPPVGLWRELRRLRAAVEAERIETVRTEADAGNWRGFVETLGGIERASRRTRSVREKYRRTMRTPSVPAYRLAVRQWRKKHGPRVARTKRPARPDEMPAVWLDAGEARRTDRAGRDVIAITRYGEQPGQRAAGICTYGLMGRFAVSDTRPYRWRIERKAQAEPPRAHRNGEPGLDGRVPPVSFSESSPRSGVRSALGPVAITVGEMTPAERRADIARIIAEARAGPNFRDFEPDRYEWPADMPKFNKQTTH